MWATTTLNTYNKQQQKTYASVVRKTHEVTDNHDLHNKTYNITERKKKAPEFSLCTSAQARISHTAHHRLGNRPGLGLHQKLHDSLQKQVPTSQNHTQTTNVRGSLYTRLLWDSLVNKEEKKHMHSSIN